jgi:hypothetical protein
MPRPSISLADARVRAVVALVPLGVGLYAWHFAFADTPTAAIASKDGDIGANPPGFDRGAFLAQLAQDIPAFFDRHFPRETPIAAAR